MTAALFAFLDALAIGTANGLQRKTFLKTPVSTSDTPFPGWR